MDGGVISYLSQAQPADSQSNPRRAMRYFLTGILTGTEMKEETNSRIMD
jgi:hypothetical protein